MIQNILKEQLIKIKPNKEELKAIEEKAQDFCLKLEKEIKRKKIKADVFLGGSLAKKTILKKDKYDIDIFVRFDRKYRDDEISELLRTIVKGKLFGLDGKSPNSFLLYSLNLL